MNGIIKKEDLLAYIQSKIYVIRGQKVMLDRDLAELYGVETRTLNQKVKRNLRRFPSDFMFQMTKEDVEEWKSQIVISNSIKMGLRKYTGGLSRCEHGYDNISIMNWLVSWNRGGVATISSKKNLYFYDC